MRRTVALLAAALGVTLLTGSACAPQDPCRTLPAPTPAEVTAAAAGAEVERPGISDAECIVTGKRWSAEPAEAH